MSVMQDGDARASTLRISSYTDTDSGRLLGTIAANYSAHNKQQNPAK